MIYNFTSLFLPKNDLKQLHAYYDKDQDGNICYNEFLGALSDGKMSQRKSQIVDKLWSLLDSENSGNCSGKDIMNCL